MAVEGGGGKFGGGGTTGNWVMGRSVAQVEPRHIEFVSIARPGTDKRGNVAVTLHMPRMAKAASDNRIRMPKHITVGVNGKGVDAFDQTGIGHYTFYRKMRPSDVPTHSVILRRTSRKKIKIGRHSWSVELTPCAAGCKSVIFGTRCLICIKTITFD